MLFKTPLKASSHVKQNIAASLPLGTSLRIVPLSTSFAYSEAWDNEKEKKRTSLFIPVTVFKEDSVHHDCKRSFFRMQGSGEDIFTFSSLLWTLNFDIPLRQKEPELCCGELFQAAPLSAIQPFSFGRKPLRNTLNSLSCHC